MEKKNKKSRQKKRSIMPLVIVVLLCLLAGAGYTYISQLYGGKRVTASYSCVDKDASVIPVYDGRDEIPLNQNIPNFVEEDFTMVKGEYYSPLDLQGRCGSAVAMLDSSMMPTEERENIGQVKPTGWNQAKYPGIISSEPPYLYNRCHLIAYGLTGQNANELNLITGTRHMNADVMLPWERKVMQYLEQSGNHVLYRVTPYFKGKELAARGVEMEAYSVEDNGEGICFHVFLYNVQPGIEIDYRDGSSKEQE